MCPTQTAGKGDSTVSCLMNKSLSKPSVPDAFSQVLPNFNIREMIPSYIPEGGQWAWMVKF